jgi:hypothetical protein
MSDERFFDDLARIDELIRSEDTNVALDELGPLLKQDVARAYFFQTLKEARWLRPLVQLGYFSTPPEPLPNPKDGSMTIRPWPESQYLSRVAREKPKDVLELASMLTRTNNLFIHRDLCDAAIELPPSLSAEWVDTELQWLRRQRGLDPILPDKLGVLVCHLVSGGQVDAALALSRELFSVKPQPSNAGVREPELRVSIWQYDQILRKVLPTLFHSAGQRAFDLMADLLESAITTLKEDGSISKPEDFSHIWRRAIEKSPLHRSQDPKNVLLNALKDGCEQILKAQSIKLTELIRRLEEREWHVFRRLAFHLVRLYGDGSPGLANRYLADQKAFGNPPLHHEYVYLAKERFSELDSETQDLILGWVVAGPDPVRFAKGHQEWTGREVAVGEYEGFKIRWQQRWLGQLSPVLPPKWKNHFKAQLATAPVISDEVESEDIATWVGPKSPRPKSDLESMSFSALVKFLKEWTPSGEWEAPSPEGLGRELSLIIAAEPQKYAPDAEDFRALDPTYVRAIVSGFREAAKQNKQFGWPSLLKLCGWVVLQETPPSATKRSHLMESDPSWEWSRKAVAELLAEGFDEGTAEIPFENRSIVWGILFHLTGDPNPTIEEEKKYASSNMDPSTIAINTTRGEALHAAIRYAEWVQRHLGFDGKLSMQYMPEVRDVLEAHLSGCPRITSPSFIRGGWSAVKTLYCPERGVGRPAGGRGKEERAWREGNGSDTSAGAEVARKTAYLGPPSGIVR